jgi:hypothetical protein
MTRIQAALVSVLFLLAGCVSTGNNLVAGVSTQQDVEAQMGKPTERLKAADGDTLWFYSRQPFGRMMYAVRVAPDGRVRSVLQTLTEENVRNAIPGTTTRAQARELFGPPYEVATNPRMQREIWTYTMWNQTQWEYFLHLQFSPDGVLREVFILKDYQKEMGDSFS